MGNRVHSGPVPSRQGGLLSTIVRWRGATSHSTRTWSRACGGDAFFAPATHAGYVQFGQLGHRVSFPGGG